MTAGWQKAGHWRYSSSVKDLQALKLYTRVARLGSFSAAARECGLSQSQASRIIAGLESELGARLLSRTTRAVMPTEAGAEFLARMEPILAAIDDAESSVRESGELRGTLRAGMPASFGIRVVLPRLAEFAERHPRLRIQLLLEDRMQDMVREAVDVGIRVGPLPDATSGTSKLIGHMDRVVVAAPSYLKRAGTPRTPADLRSHRIVGGPASALPIAWRFERNGETTTIPVEPHISINETSGAVAAVRSGLGITSTSGWAVRDELANGSLVKLLTRWKTVPFPIHAFFPAGRATRAAPRAFVELVSAAIHARHT